MISILSCWLPPFPLFVSKPLSQTLASKPCLKLLLMKSALSCWLHLFPLFISKNLSQTLASNYHLWNLFCLVDFLSSFCLFQNSYLKPLPQTTIYDLFFVLFTSSLHFVCFRTLFFWPLKFVETLALALNLCFKPLLQTTT